jgi:hypothetical protein
MLARWGLFKQAAVNKPSGRMPAGKKKQEEINKVCNRKNFNFISAYKVE